MKQEELEAKVALVKEKAKKADRWIKDLIRREDCQGIITLETLVRHGYLERHDFVEVIEYELEEVAELLNELDCEGYIEGDSHYYSKYEVRNGKICRIDHNLGYRFIK